TLRVGDSNRPISGHGALSCRCPSPALSRAKFTELGRIPLDHIYIAPGVHGNAIGEAKWAPLSQEVPICVELLDTAVAVIGHVHIPLCIQRDADRLVKLTIGRAQLAPLLQQVPLTVEFLNTVAARV